jgi:N-acetylglucosaminyldiphosphoundecaprenol N-acetyl-beta-D-mannosaminyltransferase
MMKDSENRFDVIGCKISRSSMAHGLSSLKERVKSGLGGYICFSNVHVVVTAKKDPALKSAVNNSFMSMADGKPLSLLAKFRGLTDASQVAGPDFMPYVFAQAPELKHYFYGSTEETLVKLEKQLKKKFDDIKIQGSYSPPFRPLTDEEKIAVIDRIKAAKADVVWVGLGAPKQEVWMEEYAEQLKPAILMGVGAAFDFSAGVISRAPEWMTQYGLEWLHRLLSNPRRLWKRYFYTNSLFLFYLFYDFILGKNK